MNTQRQIIDNQGELQTRSFFGAPHASEITSVSPYPGLGGNPFYGFTQGGGTSGFPALQNTIAAAAPTASSGFNFNQIKGFVDRMGGIDGIMGTMTKVQKLMVNFQQLSPMLKLFMGTFGKAKTTDVDFDRMPRRRRRRRKRSTGPNRKKYSSNKTKSSRVYKR